LKRCLFLDSCLIVCGASPLVAHDSRPILAEITETGSARYSVRWRVPASVPIFDVPEIVLPENCAAQGEGSATNESDAFVRRRTYECAQPLAGQTVLIRYPVLNPSLTTLFRMKTASGELHTKVLGPSETAWTVPSRPTALGVANEYARLGVRHILEGIDHLLFLLGLLFLVDKRWMLVKTITSFTVAHSITLGIATLGYASAPLAPLNAAIALSILFLGPEILRRRRGETSFTIRQPWIAAFAFGLLHGFGFASGLAGIGLPQSDIPLALLFFNVGVEIGQLACVMLVLLLERSFRNLEIQWPRWAEALPAYVVGTLGAFWTIQRLLLLWGINA
jgi:hydrogenase/urease accessory protein HupE